jgi:hypothetical protein
MSYLSPRAGRLPCSVIAFADTDAARAELEDWRSLAPLDDAAASGFREAIDLAPLREVEHPVAVGGDLVVRTISERNVRHVRLSVLREAAKKLLPKPDSVC